MDLDAYSAAHRDEWDELARLAGKRHFSGAEADALIERYQAGATQLSAIKTTAGQSVQGDRLSLLLSRARLRFTGASANVLSRLPEFFGAALPAALYRIRWLSLAIAAASLFVGLLYAIWAIQHPEVLASVFGGDAERRQYVEHDFVEYYSNYSGGSFASSVWTNNAWIAAQSVAFGIVGVYTPYLLFVNAMNIGYAGALMQQYGQLDTFFLYIAPHGQLELYSIFVAGAAGLRIFWAWIAPGARSRGPGAGRGCAGAVHRRDRPDPGAAHLGHHRGVRHPAGLAVAGEDRHRHGGAGRVPGLPVDPRGPGRARRAHR